MLEYHRLVVCGGCLICVLFALALLRAQYQAILPFDLTWNQLVILLAPLRLAVLSDAENLARMQINIVVISVIIKGAEDWIPSPARKQLTRIKWQRFCFHSSMLYLRIVLISGCRNFFFTHGFALVVNTYSRLIHELLSLHRAHHATRFQALAKAVRAS